MPITLPQLSRRTFLKQAALAGAVATFAPSSYAGWFGKKRAKHRFAFFSDVHISADATMIFQGMNMADNLTACVQELAAWPVRPATVIVNGDLAKLQGLPGDYALFAQLFAPVRALAPVHLSIGNHDHRENFFKALPHDVTAQPADLHRQATWFASERANWFLLDSLDRTNATPGELGAAQLAWLNRALAAQPTKPAIIVAHHNLPTPGWVAGIQDPAGLTEIFEKHRQVKAFVFGHTHNWGISEHPSGVHLINLPPTSYVYKVGSPVGWAHCTLAKDGAEFELRALDGKHADHAQPKKLVWRTS